MRQLLFIILLLFSFWGGKHLKFSLKNSTNISIKEVEVRLPDTTLHFSSLKSLSATDWINVHSAYRYGYVKFKDSLNREYVLRPVDYVGEQLYKTGSMTFIIKSIDTAKRFVDLRYSTEDK